MWWTSRRPGDDHLLPHHPAFFHQLIQGWRVPPSHIPITRLLHHLGAALWQQHHCQEGFEISGDIHGLSEHFWPPATPSGPSAAESVRLVCCHFILEGLSRAGTCQEQGSQEHLCQAQMELLLPFSFKLLPMPWPGQRVRLYKSLLEDCSKCRLASLVSQSKYQNSPLKKKKTHLGHPDLSRCLGWRALIQVSHNGGPESPGFKHRIWRHSFRWSSRSGNSQVWGEPHQTGASPLERDNLHPRNIFSSLLTI